jgi:hypothetical protein
MRGGREGIKPFNRVEFGAWFSELDQDCIGLSWFSSLVARQRHPVIRR